MIDSIRLENFKGHRDSTISLGRFTVLVGPNGAGKTSVLDALEIQSQILHVGLNQAMRGNRLFDDLLSRGAESSIALTSQGSLAGEACSCRFRITGPRPIPYEWVSGNEERSRNTRESLPPLFLQPAPLYKLNAERIAAAAYSDEPEAKVEQDGTNTAVALAAIKLGYDEDFARIEESLRRIIPILMRVRIRQAVTGRPSPANPGISERVLGSKVFFDFKGASDVPAHAASEGTLITLALLTILHSRNRSNLLLLDDFAESLHPQAQMELVRLLKRMLVEIPDLQIVATTHSPYILDELDPSEIVAFALRDDGTVAQKRLSEHPQAEKMKGALSAGQLWSLDPERDWVLPEEPA
jgi:predicted ATPase